MSDAVTSDLDAIDESFGALGRERDEVKGSGPDREREVVLRGPDERAQHLREVGRGR